MALPRAMMGLLPCAGRTQALLWLVGEGWAERVILCSGWADAKTTPRIDPVEQVMDNDEAHGAALLLAAKVTHQNPVAIRTIRPLIWSTRECAPDTWLPGEHERFVGLFDTQDARKGASAFLEKRDPRWYSC